MVFSKKQTLAGKNVLVTAGPTIEAIDPVRFLTNRSTGKMGFAIANEAASLGANVTLVTSVKNLAVDERIEVITIQSAEDMYKAVTQRSETMDIIIKAAAVADYTPDAYRPHKIKKSNDDKEAFHFIRTTDILKTLGQNKPQGQLLIGFAAESQDVEKNARLKLEAKNLDMVVANDISRQDTGFGVDTNQVTLITANDMKKLPLVTKEETALLIWKAIIALPLIEVK